MSIRIDVSAGELIDKLTILEIKLEKIADPVKLAHIRHEHALLSAALHKEVPANATLAELSEGLKSVNAELWAVEDAIREQERNGTFGAEFVALARSVYRLNDRRAALKRQINMLLRSEIIEEKSYAAY